MNALENLKQRIDYIDLPKQAQRAVDLTLEACEKSQQTYVDRCKELAAKVVHYQDRINELLGEGYKVIQERDALQAEVERLKSANLYTQIGFVHLRRWRAGNSPEHCFSEEEEQYGDVPIYVKEQAND